MTNEFTLAPCSGICDEYIDWEKDDDCEYPCDFCEYGGEDQ